MAPNSSDAHSYDYTKYNEVKSLSLINKPCNSHNWSDKYLYVLLWGAMKRGWGAFKVINLTYHARTNVTLSSDLLSPLPHYAPFLTWTE